MDAVISHSQNSVAYEENARKEIALWVDRNMDCEIADITRLHGWRAMWRVVCTRPDGARKAILVRSTRAWDAVPYSLEHDMQVNQILERNGVPVPHVYGMIEGLHAFVTDWAEGDRAPAMVTEVVESARQVSPERWQAALKYMDQLARIHAIPIEEFADTEAGNPQTSEEVATGELERFYEMLVRQGMANAVTEFFRKWLRLNLPGGPVRKCFVLGDCGQFLNRGEEVSAILDVEVGHIGHPYRDLACLPMRDIVEQMGDIPALFRRYAKASGQPIDLYAVAYYLISMQALTATFATASLANIREGGNWVEGVMQATLWTRSGLESMAELTGAKLDSFADVPLPPSAISRYGDLAFDKLENETGSLPASAEFPAWQRDILAELPRFLHNEARYGRWVEAEDIKDISAVIGVEAANMVEAEKALTTHVLQAGPDQDAILIRLFHRRAMRMCRLLAGPEAAEGNLMFLSVRRILTMDLIADD